MIWPRLDWRSVAIGALVTLAVVVPAGIAASVADDASNVSLVLSAVILTGFLLGGLISARRQPHAPLAHGATAALAAFLAFQAVGVVLRLVRGDEVHPVRIVAVALLAASVGLVGGFVANVLRIRAERDQRASTEAQPRHARSELRAQREPGSAEDAP